MQNINDNVKKEKTAVKNNSLLPFLKNNAGSFFSSALTAYIIVSVCNMLFIKEKTDKLDYIMSVNGLMTLGIFFIALVILFNVSLLKNIGKKILYSVMLAAVLIFAVFVISDNRNNVYLAMGVSAVAAFFVYYIINSGYMFKNKIIDNYKIAFVVVAAAFLGVSILTSIHTVYRYVTFSASNFDFGIFAQLFENMAKSGSTVISVERNKMLSHFFNHFSPIYYVILPIYMIFRMPQALLVIQAIFVAASAFPMFLIGKKYGLTPFLAMLMGLIAVFLPGFINPLFYDFHENKFLPFFLLWFIYFFISKKYKLSYLFMFLTLMIKEDAAIYVICVLLYFMIVKKEIKPGLTGLCITILYFVPVMIFMRSYGLDFVGWRYNVYFLSGQNKIGQMIQNIIMNPAFFIKNIFSEECMVFIFYMLGPLLFVPLITKDFKKLVLLIPFVAINIMTDYPYQHDIGFQYTYGSLTLMLLLFADNINCMPHNWKKVVLISSLTATIVMSISACDNKFQIFRDNYENNKEMFEEADRQLDRIPDDVSITANSYILTHLCEHEELYMMDSTFRETDYYVLDKGDPTQINDFENSEIFSEYVLCLDGRKVKIYKNKKAEKLLPE